MPACDPVSAGRIRDPWITIEQNTVRAARLKITVPDEIRWLSTSSENVIVATPLGPNQDMKVRVAVSVEVPARAANTPTGRATRRVDRHHPDRRPPGAEQAVQGQQRTEDDEDSQLDYLHDGGRLTLE